MASDSTAPTGLIGVLVKERYLVESVLGRGGFATTYRAADTHLNSRPVVVKVLLDHRAEDPWVLKKFSQEMQALARLDHPGIVSALDFGQLADGKPFLVMQFVKGDTLRRAITPRGMDLDRVALLIRQLGYALTTAHDAGICHRDVKPENIMLQNSGEADEQTKLLDFGIASIRDSVTTHSKDSSIMSGSWAYMAPEQFDAKSSPLSDLYALGVVAFELATGRTPFNAESPMQLVKMQLTGLKITARDLRPGIPEAAEAAILKALSMEPAARHARARDFGEALSAALHATRPVAATRASRAEHAEQTLEIAHVLFMDLVGFSKMPMDHQAAHLSILQRTVTATPEFVKADAAHQLTSLPTGDGMALAFYGDPVLPVRCALSVAEALKAHPDVKLRMGVHTGPVYRHSDINANSNVTGGGINTAQRVMDCGDAGHILLSRNVAETIGQLSTWESLLTDLGEHAVKHGAKVHLFNLCTGNAGNPALPEKLQRDSDAEAASRIQRATEEREAAAKAERDRIAQETAAKQEAEREAAERNRIALENAAKEQAERERKAAAKAEHDRIALETAARDAAEREAAERNQIALENAAKERAEREREAAAKAERDRIAQETAAKERAEREREVAAKAEHDRIASETAARDAAEREAAERDRVARENATKREASRREAASNAAGNIVHSAGGSSRTRLLLLVGIPILALVAWAIWPSGERKPIQVSDPTATTQTLERPVKPKEPEKSTQSGPRPTPLSVGKTAAGRKTEPAAPASQPPAPNHALLGDHARDAGDYRTALRHYRALGDPTRLAKLQSAIEGDVEERVAGLLDQGRYGDAISLTDGWLREFPGSQRLQKMRAKGVRARDSQ